MSSKKLKLIAVDENNYLILKRMGYTSESFNDVITRLLKNQMLESVSRVGTRGPDSNMQ
jgi:predicted CopG family antitoxin